MIGLVKRPPPQSGAGDPFVRDALCVFFLEGFTVNEPHRTMIRRRDLLLAMSVSGVAAVASMTSTGSTHSDAVLRRDKRKPQYQANSPEVQTFYRVNRYPGK
jgi:hypothetical protein